MTRHKSRVARIRRARRGTRKQSGGMFEALFSSLFGKKTIVPVPGTADTHQTPPPPPVAAPAGAVQPPPPAATPEQDGGRKKSRKTRHRRHRK